MKMKARVLFLVTTNLLLLPLLSSCSHLPLEDEAASVKVYFSLGEKEKTEIASCDHLGDIIGSDGNMMSNFFISNVNLTRGSLNDLRNKANAMGGDTVFILRNPLSYATSTTMVGSVYICNKQ